MGLDFSFEARRTCWIEINASHLPSACFSTGDGKDVFAADKDCLLMLGNAFRADAAFEYDTDKRIEKFHASISSSVKHLCCKSAPLKDRAKLLMKLGGSASLWSIESTTLLRQSLERVQNQFNYQAFKMQRYRYHDNIGVPFGVFGLVIEKGSSKIYRNL